MVNDKGYVKIANEADRLTVAAVLIKNGYTVTPLRRKRGSTWEQLLGYERRGRDLTEDENRPG